MSVFELSWTPENRFKVFLLTPHSPPPSVCADPGCHPVAGRGYRVTARARQRRPPSAPLAWLTNECGQRLDQSQPSTASRDHRQPTTARPAPSRAAAAPMERQISLCRVVWFAPAAPQLPRCVPGVSRLLSYVLCLPTHWRSSQSDVLRNSGILTLCPHSGNKNQLQK